MRWRDPLRTLTTLSYGVLPLPSLPEVMRNQTPLALLSSLFVVSRRRGDWKRRNDVTVSTGKQPLICSEILSFVRDDDDDDDHDDGRWQTQNWDELADFLSQ